MRHNFITLLLLTIVIGTLARTRHSHSNIPTLDDDNNEIDADVAPPPPPHKEYAKVARYLVHRSGNKPIKVSMAKHS